MENLKVEKRTCTEIEKLLSLAHHYIEEDVSAHEMEKGLLSQLLCLGLVLLKYVIEQKVAQLAGYHPTTQEGEVLESKGLKERKYLSLFGMLDILRTRHWSKQRGSYYELDERLSLPKESFWSYNIQELIGENASRE